MIRLNAEMRKTINTEAGDAEVFVKAADECGGKRSDKWVVVTVFGTGRTFGLNEDGSVA